MMNNLFDSLSSAIESDDSDRAFDLIESHFSSTYLLVACDDGFNAVIRTTMDDFTNLSEKVKEKIRTLVGDHYRSSAEIVLTDCEITKDPGEKYRASMGAYIGSKGKDAEALVPYIMISISPVYVS